MKNLELESEAIRISKFCHVICQMLFLHREISITKLIFFAYIIKTKNEYLSTIFTAKNSKFLDDKIISMLSGDFDNYCKSIDIIIKALHVLIVNQNCKIEDDTIFFISRKGYENEIYDNKSFIYKVIESCKDVEDFQFLKEIVQNV